MTTPRPEEELYDLKTDPHELHNLAGDPEYKDKLLELRQKVDQWIEEIGDQGRIPEKEEDIAPYGKWLDSFMRKTLKNMGLKSLDTDELYNYWMRRYDSMMRNRGLLGEVR